MPQLAAQFLTSPQANAVQSSSESASSESIDNRLPPSVSDLVSSFEAARERCMFGPCTIYLNL